MSKIPSFVVTCSRERLAQFREAFTATGLDRLEVKEWTGCRIPGDGSLGNSMSQYALVRHALESGMDSILVFEDDAVPSDRANELLDKEIEEARRRGDGVVRLGWMYLPADLASDPTAEVKHMYGSHAYAILSQDAIRSYLDAWPKQGRADCVFDHMEGVRVGRSSESLFAQLTPPDAFPGIHRPPGWSLDAELSRLESEATDVYSKARAIHERRKADRTIHVAYTVDVQGVGAAQFCDQLVVGVHALKASLGPEEAMHVHVFYGHLPSDTVARLHGVQGTDFRVDISRISDHNLACLQSIATRDPKSPVRTWGGIVFARLWLPLMMPSVDRCIYLDADTLVRRSLRALWSTDLKGNLLGMNWGTVEEYGYNSGVILMDLKAMRGDKGLFDRLNAFLEANARKFYCPDQTAINRFFKDRILPIGREWNFPPTPGQNDPGTANAAIWHWYNGQQKPRRLFGDDYGRSLLEWNSLAARFGI